jgi:hypothetical protein
MLTIDTREHYVNQRYQILEDRHGAMFEDMKEHVSIMNPVLERSRKGPWLLAYGDSNPKRYLVFDTRNGSYREYAKPDDAPLELQEDLGKLKTD